MNKRRNINMNKIMYNDKVYKIKKVKNSCCWGVFDDKYCYGEFEDNPPTEQEAIELIKENLVRLI